MTDEAPQQWFTCNACDGSGEIVTGHWGYEPGCGHGHMMDHGSPCSRCGGEGGRLDDVEHDPMCPRCGMNPLGQAPIFLSTEAEGHICDACWQQDRAAETPQVHAFQ